MYNRDYEEYMRSVLGYKPNNEAYNNSTYENYNLDYNNLFPEIYTKLDPVISRICSMNTKPINEDTLNEMVNAIVSNVNLDEYMEIIREEPKLRNGDVRNPNAKDGTENRQRRPSKLLKDLIKILILNKLLNFGNQKTPYNMPNRPGSIPPPLYNNIPGNKYTMF